jgi:hypothetical protein
VAWPGLSRASLLDASKISRASFSFEFSGRAACRDHMLSASALPTQPAARRKMTLHPQPVARSPRDVAQNTPQQVELRPTPNVENGIQIKGTAIEYRFWNMKYGNLKCPLSYVQHSYTHIFSSEMVYNVPCSITWCVGVPVHY